MYILALATDYDGTIAQDGTVLPQTMSSLKRLKAAGRRLILITGRRLPELESACSDLSIFDSIVAENGALIFDPITRAERLIAPAPSAELIMRLRERGVEPLSIGRSIIATWQPHESVVLQAIHDLGLELQIFFNKGAVMILPAGINKGIGLLTALHDLDVSAHNVVGVGDAENDHTFLVSCGCSAAVANALPVIKKAANILLKGDHGAGVMELADRIVLDDASIIPPSRQGIVIGMDAFSNKALLEPFSGITLIAGPPCSGKSTLATALTERMAESKFEFCIFDPEGDYARLAQALQIGDIHNPPKLAHALQLIGDAGVNAVINTQALSFSDRRHYFSKLLPAILDLRGRTGRPHWVLIDEAHQFFMNDNQPNFGRDWEGPALILITVRPESLPHQILQMVDTVIGVGPHPFDVITAFAKAAGICGPDKVDPRPSEILVWETRSGRPLRYVTADRPIQIHTRHSRKYAEGDVGQERSFYFRGPNATMNRRAKNLQGFLQIAKEVDDRVWEYHLRAGHYSAWFELVIRNSKLAREVANIEGNMALTAAESRNLIERAICQKYIVSSP